MSIPSLGVGAALARVAGGLHGGNSSPMGCSELTPVVKGLMELLGLEWLANLHQLCEGKVLGIDGHALLHRAASIPLLFWVHFRLSNAGVDDRFRRDTGKKTRQKGCV